MRNYSSPSLKRHQEDTTWSGSSVTSPSACTVDPNGTPWANMYVNDKYARDRVMKAARLLLPYLKDNDVILDVGCFTQEAKKYFPPWVKYLGIDEKAYHRDTKVVNLHDGFDPIASSHALCLETLEHLLDPLDTLKSIASSLSDTGLLVVSLPNESTLFHRIRALFGIVDAGCFSGEGKHIHLPSLHQSRAFLSRTFHIEKELYYISPTACGSHQEWIGKLLQILPDKVHQFL